MYRPPPNSLGQSAAVSADELKDFVSTDETPGARTLFVGNIDARVDRKLLHEVMIQAGPVEAIKLMPAKEGASKTIAFVRFEHAASLRYALLVLDEVVLFRSPLSVNYSGMHKAKPRPQYPSVSSTFFELPLGLQAMSDENKQTLVDAQVIPTLEYLSGYYINSSGYGEATPNEQNYYEAPNGRTPNHGRVRREAYRAPEGSHHHESYGSGGARGQYADYHRNNLERSYSQPDNSHHEHHSPANNYHRSTRHLSRDESYNSGYGSHSYNEQERYREDFPYNHHHQNSGQKRVRR